MIPPLVNLQDMNIVMLYSYIGFCAEMTEIDLPEDHKREFRVRLIEAQAELYRRRNDQ